MSELNGATVDALAKLLAEITGRPLVALRSMAANLREAGMLPDDGEPITSDHAANLVVVAVGASAASEAVEAVRLIGGIPLVVQHHWTVGPDGSGYAETKAVADIPIAASCGAEWAKFSGSLVGAVSNFVESAKRQSAVYPLTFLSLRRSLSVPLATFEIHVPHNDGFRELAWLVFGNEGQEAAYTVAALRTSTSVYVPGLLFRLVGDLLAGRSCADAEPSMTSVPSAAAAGAK